jgi:hypothetical protein
MRMRAAQCGAGPLAAVSLIQSTIAARFAAGCALSRMTGIDIVWRFLFPLRNHFRRIRPAGDATRAELLALLVILGLARTAVIELRTPSAAVLVMDLPARLEFLAGGRMLSLDHR